MTSLQTQVSACGKAILAQDLVITRGTGAMDLVLLAANLDTDDDAKRGQLKELKECRRVWLVCMRLNSTPPFIPF